MMTTFVDTTEKLYILSVLCGRQNDFIRMCESAKGYFFKMQNIARKDADLVR